MDSEKLKKMLAGISIATLLTALPVIVSCSKTASA